jgi:hypothetical protein
MSELTRMLNSLEHRFGVDERHLRAALLAWAKSGSTGAPPSVFRALEGFRADLQHGASRARRLRLGDAREKHVRTLLAKACSQAALAMQMAALASSAADPAAQEAGWRAANHSLKSVAKLYDEARRAAGCGKTC